MIYYFVDFENIAYECANYIRDEDPKDSKFFIYYSTKTPNPSWDFIFQLLAFSKEGYRFEFVKCPAGDQACDKFILVDIACHAAKSLQRDYIVLTKDKGFMAPIEQICKRTHANIQIRGEYRCNTEEDFDGISEE